MSLIRWHDRFVVGVPALDSDHRMIVALLNQLFEAREEGQARDVVASILNVLVEYTLVHFANEERLMLAVGFPDHSLHCGKHEDFANKLHVLRRQYDCGHHGAVDELVEILKNWLVEHIVDEDTLIGSWIAGAGLGDGAVAMISRMTPAADD
ncbi:MAG: bacteriohemerythrin [Telmatospirillum sp.]|nr:bacteriohemerythrin [Telmatospirillum sp.]